MASPTTAILVVAIFCSSFSSRSRVSMKTDCGLRISDCGFEPTRPIRNPQSTIRNQLWCSRNPSFLSRSPLQLNRPDPPRLLRAVVDQMDAAVARERPAIAREVTGEREPHRPPDRPADRGPRGPRRRDGRRDVVSEEIISLQPLIVLLQDAEGDDIVEPGLELARRPGDERPF